MSYYNYNPDTLHYLSTTEKPGVYSTTVAPNLAGLADGEAAVFDTVTQTWTNTADPGLLPAVKAAAIAAVMAAYPAAADAWVTSGATYQYLPSDINTILKTRTTTADVTVKRKLIAAPYTESTATTNDAAFKVIILAVATAMQARITLFRGYLATITAATTLAQVAAVVASL